MFKDKISQIKSSGNSFFRKIKKIIMFLSVPIRTALKRLKAWQRFWASFRIYQLLADKEASISGSLESISLCPCIWDVTSITPIEPTYFYQDSWAFELIVKDRPKSHVDIGSHHKYVALLSKIVPLTMVDIRPFSCTLDSIKFVEGSILSIPFPDQSINSLSSLCVIEHIGLGRYGDPMDPNGSIKACSELSRVIAPGGNLYISIPVEENPKTYFNAHRSFNEKSFLALFPDFTLENRAYIYGNHFVSDLKEHFGIACYHFSRTH